MLKFLLLSPSVDGKDFSDARVNPGVGGTEYLVVLLATLFAKTFPDVDVVIFTKYQFRYDNSIQNLSVIRIHCLSDISKTYAENGKWVLTVNVAWTLYRCDNIAMFKKLILWSHHPSDWRARILAKSSFLTISTGFYQYCSNLGVHSNHLLFPNIFLRKHLDVKVHKSRRNEAFNVMYLGALIPAKGFHHLLQQWAHVCDAIPNAKLHVIGGSNLYGNTEDTAVNLPCDPLYAKVLQPILKQSKKVNDTVIFYGTLGEERFDIYRDMDVAIINPKGKSESFSFNLHECLDHGIPVVTSQDYGLNDVMTYFPEQSISSPRQIPRVLAKLHRKPEMLMRYQEHVTDYLELLENRNLEVLGMWRAIIFDKPVKKIDFAINWSRFKGYFRSSLVSFKIIAFRVKALFE
ncbi:glycosyltransferase [Amylibacter sp.]|nr:glycosyltransferase [Amylibacter sp.]